jgi:transcriptional regulator with XRE-family HTH domain/Zn-dependent peptidase ImmA (M78 family)
MSGKDYFPKRLRSARKMNGLTLDALSERIGRRVTKQALNKYEQGTAYPDPSLLQPLCMALEVRPDYFTRQFRVELEHYHFQKLDQLPKKEQAIALEKTRDALERYGELEELLGLEPVFNRRIPGLPAPVRTHQEAENAAGAVRAHYELGAGPLFNVLEILEESGIKVVEIELSEGFSAMSGFAGKDNPVIALNGSEKIKPEQKRFAALREFGRLLLDIEAESEKEADRLCDTFAGAMLLPGPKIANLLGAHRSSLIWNELTLLKSLYGISIRDILQRARAHGVITNYDLTTRMAALSRFYGRKGEPGKYEGMEKALRFRRLLLRAVAESVVSASKAAALSGKSLAEFREELKSENEGRNN